MMIYFQYIGAYKIVRKVSDLRAVVKNKKIILKD